MSQTDAAFCGVDDGRPNSGVAAKIEGSPRISPRAGGEALGSMRRRQTHRDECRRRPLGDRPIPIHCCLPVHCCLPASRSHSPYSWPQLNGNAATDERSRPRQDGRHTVVARGITGDFTAEHAAAGTACGDGVFNGANSPCRCHRIHARRSGRRIDHRQAVPDGMLAR